MTKLIRYESKENGIRVYGPLYTSLEIRVNGCCNGNSLRRREVEIGSSKESVVKARLVDLTSGVVVGNPHRWFDLGYKIKPNSDGKVNGRFDFGFIDYFDGSDLASDYFSKIVRRKADEIANGVTNKYELAHKIYEYVYNIPFTGENELVKSKTPRMVILSNKARKCICKAKLFVDICRVLGIPARSQRLEHYCDEQIERYVKSKKKSSENNDHQFAAFFYDGWRLVDPSLGGFDSDFAFKNYYEILVYARGMDSFNVIRK